jgi:hypothetical protein
MATAIISPWFDLELGAELASIDCPHQDRQNRDDWIVHQRPVRYEEDINPGAGLFLLRFAS